jgi:hypothetical protein
VIYSVVYYRGIRQETRNSCLGSSFELYKSNGQLYIGGLVCAVVDDFIVQAPGFGITLPGFWVAAVESVPSAMGDCIQQLSSWIFRAH